MGSKFVIIQDPQQIYKVRYHPCQMHLCLSESL
jgi:hypothetical protein